VAEPLAADGDTLRLVGVRKSYGTGTPLEVEVLHGIDLTLRHGEFAALIGPSGSGKSTLLNLVGLLDRPSSGQIFIDGQDAGTLDELALTTLRGRAIGFIFQYHHLLPAFTALENVMMPMLAARGAPTTACGRRPPRCSTGLALRAGATRRPPTSRADSSSVWRLPVRWP